MDKFKLLDLIATYADLSERQTPEQFLATLKDIKEIWKAVDGFKLKSSELKEKLNELLSFKKQGVVNVTLDKDIEVLKNKVNDLDKYIERLRAFEPENEIINYTNTYKEVIAPKAIDRYYEFVKDSDYTKHVLLFQKDFPMLEDKDFALNVSKFIREGFNGKSMVYRKNESGVTDVDYSKEFCSKLKKMNNCIEKRKVISKNKSDSDKELNNYEKSKEYIENVLDMQKYFPMLKDEEFTVKLYNFFEKGFDGGDLVEALIYYNNKGKDFLGELHGKFQKFSDYVSFYEIKLKRKLQAESYIKNYDTIFNFINNRPKIYGFYSMVEEDLKRFTGKKCYDLDKKNDYPVYMQMIEKHIKDCDDIYKIAENSLKESKQIANIDLKNKRKEEFEDANNILRNKIDNDNKQDKSNIFAKIKNIFIK